MDFILGETPYSNCKEVEMFFFPVHHERHYYVITIDLRSHQCLILDKSTSQNTKKKRYQDIPGVLIDLFAGFLLAKKQKQSATAVRKMTPFKLLLPWRDHEDPNNSGVIAMRHMEDYEGQTVTTWNCGLQKLRPDLTLQFRKQYLHAIVTFNFNALAEDNVKKTMAFEKKKNTKKNVGTSK